jgi:hypothetical protein
MALILVPKTPKTAFDKNRRPSSLLLSQIEHLEWAVLPASKRKPHQLPKQKVKTEGQAAERVAQLTTLLLAPKAAAAEQTAAAPATLPPIPKVEARSSSARKRSPLVRRTKAPAPRRRRAAKNSGSQARSKTAGKTSKKTTGSARGRRFRE